MKFYEFSSIMCARRQNEAVFVFDLLSMQRNGTRPSQVIKLNAFAIYHLRQPIPFISIRCVRYMCTWRQYVVAQHPHSCSARPHDNNNNQDKWLLNGSRQSNPCTMYMWTVMGGCWIFVRPHMQQEAIYPHITIKMKKIIMKIAKRKLLSVLAAYVQ